MAGEVQETKGIGIDWNNWHNNAVPQETEQDRLKKTNVWDFAASMQPGAYQS